MRSKQLILTILSLYCGIASAGELLRLGYVEYPPLVYSEKENVPKGPLIDYIEKSLEAEFEIKWIDMPLGRARWAFENDVIDAFPFLMRLEEREAWIHYFERPYLTIQNIVCSRGDMKFTAENPGSLVDLMAGSTLVFPLNAGYKYPFLSDPRIEQINIHYTNYIDRSLGLLNKGRAKYVFYSSKAGLELGGKNKNLSCVDVGERVGLHFAFSKNNRLAPGVESILSRLEILRW
jgi:ABC-type amino acid transport substrate-binding protein